MLHKNLNDLFTKDVANARGLDINHSENYADAHIFSAHRAKDAGLIDRVGVKFQAKKELETLAKVKKPSWKEKDKIESFLDNLATKGIMQIQNYFWGLKASL